MRDHTIPTSQLRKLGYQASLPDARLVRARRSVIKLHGGRYGLRADFTLDTYPQAEAVENFKSYLSIYDGQGRKHGQAQRSILVMGISGEEKRTVGLICHALLEFTDEFQVYWVCHQKADVERIVSVFRATLRHIVDEQQGRDSSASDKPGDSVESAMRRLRVTSAPDLGLFLLELYQNIFLCLPPAGVSFDTAWPVPPPCPTSFQRHSGLRAAVTELEKSVARQLAESGRPLLVLGDRGLPLVGTEAFYSMTGKYHCVWLELEQSFDVAGFVLRVLSCSVREVGMSSMPPFPLVRHSFDSGDVPEPLGSYLKALSAQAARRIVVFINARNFPGQMKERHQWKPENLVQLIRAIEWLGQKIMVVVLGWPEAFEAWANCERLRLEHGLKMDLPDQVAAKIVNQISSWEVANEWKRFVLGMTLFRHTCYLSALQSWALQKAPRRFAVFEDNDAARFERTLRFLDTMRGWGAVRDDEGQTAFMYPALRSEIRRRILATDYSRAEWAESHQGIADWYVKLYRTSGDVRAALEAILHRVGCVAEALAIDPASEHSDRNRKPSLLSSAANEIAITLDLVCETVLSSPQTSTLIHLIDEAGSNIQQCVNRARLQGEKPELLASLERSRTRLVDLKSDYFDMIGHGPVDASSRRSGTTAHDASADTHKTPPPETPPILPDCGGDAAPAAKALAEAEKAVRDFVQCVHVRQYKEAEAQAGSLLGRYDIDLNDIFGNSVRENARRWVQKHVASGGGVSQRRVQLVLQIVRRYQLLKIYQAGLQRFNERPGGEREATLVQAEKLYIFSTEVMRYVDDVNFLQIENALLRMNTGIVLSWMNRHHEAHRRFSESYGYLNHSSTPLKSMRYATVDLSRTDTFLCQLYKSREASTELGIGLALMEQYGLVYDAIAGVERAMYKVADTTVKTRWYAWLRELELCVCCEVARLAQREKGADSWFARCRGTGALVEWFCCSVKDASYVVGKDTLRLARYVALAREFSGLVGLGANGTVAKLKLIEEFAKRASEGQLEPVLSDPTGRPLDPDVKAYVQRVVSAHPAAGAVSPPLSVVGTRSTVGE